MMKICSVLVRVCVSLRECFAIYLGDYLPDLIQMLYFCFIGYTNPRPSLLLTLFKLSFESYDHFQGGFTNPHPDTRPLRAYP